FPLPTLEHRAIANGSSDDGTLPRVGAEFTIVSTSSTELSLRAGYFREPAHGTRLQLFLDENPRDRKPDTNVPANAPPFSQAYDTVFDGGRAENHVSFGLGATFSRRISVDLAFDVASTTKLGVLSVFGRF